jgi:hypothetical protein
MKRRSAHGRRSAIGTFIACTVLVVLGLLAPSLISKGAYNLWAQHSGTPARVEIGKCWQPTIFSFPGEFGTGGARRGGSKTSNCTAVWQPAVGTKETVTVYGVGRPTPRSVDVHIHGDRAFTNSLWLPAPLLWGSIAVGFVLFRLRALRRSRASRPSLFHRGPEVSDPATLNRLPLAEVASISAPSHGL